MAKQKSPQGQKNKVQNKPAKDAKQQLSASNEVPQERLAELLSHVAMVAQSLRQAQDSSASLAALQPITSLPMNEQLALLTVMGQQRQASGNDALDVALAWEQLGKDRAVTKEAKRCTIKLRSAGCTASIDLQAFKSPTNIASITPMTDAVPVQYTYAGGWASRTRETSEVYIGIAWNRPVDSDVDGFVVQINYWDGHFTLGDHFNPMSLRRFNSAVTDFTDESDEKMSWEPITAEEALGLLEGGRDIIAWRKQLPEWDEAEEDTEWHEVERILMRRFERLNIVATTPDSQRFLNTEMTDQETLINFWGSWAFGDYELVYELLAANSGLRERQTRTEFIETHRQWYVEAKPARFELGGLALQEKEQGGIWLPTGGNRANTGQVNLKLFASLEFQETPIAGQLEEFPMSTLANPDTSRHWFWQSATLERNAANQWRVSRLRDEGASAQSTSIELLLKRTDDLWDEANKLLPQDETAQLDNRDAIRVVALTQESLSIGECALMRLPLDRSLYEKLRDRSAQTLQWERVTAIVRRMIPRFPDQANLLQMLASAYFQAAEQMTEIDEHDNRSQKYLEITEAVMRETVDIERSAQSVTMLAELLVSKGALDEAEALLREATEIDDTTAGAWLDLGDLLMRRQDSIAGVSAFEKAAQLEPTNKSVRWRLGSALEFADRAGEAQLVYEDALIQDPQDAMAHALLGKLLLFETDDLDEAEEHLRTAIALGLVSGTIIVQLANIAARKGNFADSRALLSKAAEIDPSIAQDIERLQDEVNKAERSLRQGR